MKELVQTTTVLLTCLFFLQETCIDKLRELLIAYHKTVPVPIMSNKYDDSLFLRIVFLQDLVLEHQLSTREITQLEDRSGKMTLLIDKGKLEHKQSQNGIRSN